MLTVVSQLPKIRETSGADRPCGCATVGMCPESADVAVPIAKRVSIVVPVLNQVEYTRGCLDSLRPDLEAGIELIIIDNNSTDETPNYLNSLSGVNVIRNETNRGCAGGWNQGVKAATREWIVVLNNDVVVGPGWLEAMAQFAESSGCGVVTPAIREGPINYAFREYAADFVIRMGSVQRIGVANGICFMVARWVFEKVGLFDERFRIGQFEDADFFIRARNAGIKLGTTGRAFLHHYGSVTQNAIRKKAEVASYEAENRAYFRAKWGLTKLRRLGLRTRLQFRCISWRLFEGWRFGHSLHEKWVNGKVELF